MVGWDAAGLRTLLSVPITDEPPLRKPGCAAKNTYDAEELRLLDGAGIRRARGDVRPRLDGRAAGDPADVERVEAMLGGRDPDRALGEMAPAMLR